MQSPKFKVGDIVITTYNNIFMEIIEIHDCRYYLKYCSSGLSSVFAWSEDEFKLVSKLEKAML